MVRNSSIAVPCITGISPEVCNTSTSTKLELYYNNVVRFRYVRYFIEDSYLSQQITKCPSNKGSKCLGSQWALVQSSVVSGPSGDGSSTNEGRITEEGALGGGALAEGGLDDIVRKRSTALGDGRVGGNTEGAGASRDEKEAKKLHGD